MERRACADAAKHPHSYRNQPIHSSARAERDKKSPNRYGRKPFARPALLETKSPDGTGAEVCDNARTASILPQQGVAGKVVPLNSSLGTFTAFTSTLADSSRSNSAIAGSKVDNSRPCGLPVSHRGSPSERKAAPDARISPLGN
jgi:hypothetical protein